MVQLWKKKKKKQMQDILKQICILKQMQDIIRFVETNLGQRQCNMNLIGVVTFSGSDSFNVTGQQIRHSRENLEFFGGL